eukprot:2085662-Rhodomonas_salina.1
MCAVTSPPRRRARRRRRGRSPAEPSPLLPAVAHPTSPPCARAVSLPLLPPSALPRARAPPLEEHCQREMGSRGGENRSQRRRRSQRRGVRAPASPSSSWKVEGG